MTRLDLRGSQQFAAWCYNLYVLMSYKVCGILVLVALDFGLALFGAIRMPRFRQLPQSASSWRKFHHFTSTLGCPSRLRDAQNLMRIKGLLCSPSCSSSSQIVVAVTSQSHPTCSRRRSRVQAMAVGTAQRAELIRSPQDQKEYAGVKLDNGLQVLLIRDPEMKLEGVLDAHQVTVLLSTSAIGSE